MPTGVPQLAAWPSSGTSANKKAFQQKLLDYWQHLGGAKLPQIKESFFTKWDSQCNERDGVPLLDL